MNQITFYRALKAHCTQEKADCEHCCLRLYCYTPPCEQTDSMMDKVISFFANAHIRTDDQDDSGRYICAPERPCPCTLDMSNALGFDDLR